ncbi:unnamed protein product [Euphydryas editha]|uniref:Uncharacterized protein n=1 Tax=Euphydryas editha TaxID=104508 RepID=A0AAU9TQG9_EUPED|nr:unnamed protein product [Euphydryas editha]
MVITRKHMNYDTPRLHVGGIDIGMVGELKLLRVVLDQRLTFNTHVANGCKKAVAFYAYNIKYVSQLTMTRILDIRNKFEAMFSYGLRFKILNNSVAIDQ